MIGGGGSRMRLRGREVVWLPRSREWRVVLEDGTFVFAAKLELLDEFLEHVDLRQGAEYAQTPQEA